jgi:hypothetical protein
MRKKYTIHKRLKYTKKSKIKKKSKNKKKTKRKQRGGSQQTERSLQTERQLRANLEESENQLQAELAERQEQLQRAAELGQGLMERVEDLENAIASSLEESVILQGEIDQWKEASQIMANKMSGRGIHNEYLPPEEIRDMLDNYISTVKEDEREALEDLSKQCDDELKECTDRQEELSTQNNTLTRLIAEKEEAMAELNRAAVEIEGGHEAARAMEIKLQDEIAELKGKVDMQIQERENSVIELKASKTEVDRLTGELAQETERCKGEIKNVSDDYAEKRKELQAQSQDRERKIDVLSNQIVEGKQREDGLATQLQQKQEEIEKLKQLNIEGGLKLERSTVECDGNIQRARQDKELLHKVVDEHIEKVAKLLDCRTGGKPPEPPVQAEHGHRVETPQKQLQSHILDDEGSDIHSPGLEEALEVAGAKGRKQLEAVAASRDRRAAKQPPVLSAPVDESKLADARQRLAEMEERAKERALPKHEAEQRAARGE